MKERSRVSLATKFLLLVLAVLLVAVVSGGVSVYTSRELEKIFKAAVAENLASVRAAEELEIALLEQRGLVSAYILDDLNQEWLDSLREVEPRFDEWLMKARQSAHGPDEIRILDQLETIYEGYRERRESVIELCAEGHVAEATRVLLNEVHEQYLAAYDECEAFLRANDESVTAALAKAKSRVRQLSVLLGSLALTTLLLAGTLLWLFFARVLAPLKRIAADLRELSISAEAVAPVGGPRDELAAIREHLNALMSDVAGARSDLLVSQDQLLQAEKLASVGRLAASVAHEIRNPLTAMKMWLFSLRKSVGQSPESDRKFVLISEELSRLENVVQNFLEFSRPPQLKAQADSLAELVEKTLELLGPRLADRRLVVKVGPLCGLPQVLIDREQMKQVLINLLMNAADAMPEGGEVTVTASLQADSRGKTMVVLRIRDHGPGISNDAQELIFRPFFTTKETGTGLGLCIAAQIMASHGGRLSLESTSSQGSCFAMWVPCL